MNFFDSRRGDIAIMVLVIGVFAVCVFALFIFLKADYSFSQNLESVSFMEQFNSYLDQYFFLIHSGVSGEELKDIFNIREIDGKTQIYFEEKRGGKFIFSVQYPLP